MCCLLTRPTPQMRRVLKKNVFFFFIQWHIRAFASNHFYDNVFSLKVREVGRCLVQVIWTNHRYNVWVESVHVHNWIYYARKPKPAFMLPRHVISNNVPNTVHPRITRNWNCKNLVTRDSITYLTPKCWKKLVESDLFFFFNGLEKIAM